ncbi:MAG: alpha/beta fold hydrolase [Myxococcota bacterium]
MTPDHPSDPPLRRVVTDLGPVMLTDTGSGPAILALHGAPGSHRDFRWLESALGTRVRMIRPDLPGFGTTPWETHPERTPMSRARLIEPLLDALRIDRCVLLGHSLGGPLAIAASPSERVVGLVLVASPGVRPHRGYRMAQPHLWSAVLDRRGMASLLRPIVRFSFNAAGFPRSTPYPDLVSTLRCFGALDFVSMAVAVGALQVPTFLTWSEDDPLIETRISRELAALAPAGPRLGFSTGGHNIQKTRATEIGEALVPFVEGLFGA